MNEAKRSPQGSGNECIGVHNKNNAWSEEYTMNLPLKLLIHLTWLLTSYPAYADTAPLAGARDKDPFFVVVMGDSIALGVWADSKVGDPGPYFYASAASASLETSLLSSFNKFRLNDLGDAEKYSAAVDGFFGYISRPQFSALTGRQDYSIPQRIKRATGRDVDLLDTSFLAGCYRLSSLHLSKLERFMRKHPGHKAPDLIFVNFTAMDFVFNDSITQFERDIHMFYARLTGEYPNATIIVNTLVDVVSSMSTSLDEVALPGNFLFKRSTCADNYQRVGFGSLIGIKRGVTGEHLDMLHEKLDTMNRIIAFELATIDSHIYPYEAFAGRAIEVGPFEPATGRWFDYLAADCIHPNIRGQQRYSDLIWDAVRDQINP